MNFRDLKRIGQLLKARRESLGKSQKDFADKFLSVSAISRIENGKSVNPEKVRIYAERLGVSLDQLAKKDDVGPILLRLKAIQHGMEMGKHEDANQQLDEMQIGEGHPLKGYWHFLKGFYYRRNKRYGKARSHFQESIKMCDLHPDFEYLNIKMLAYNNLATISYFLNDLDQAIHMVQKAVESFVEGGEREQSIYPMRVNLATYLVKKDRFEEAQQILDDLWTVIDKIKDPETILHLYQLKGEILKNTGMPRKAIQYLNEGLELARLMRATSRALEMWVELGDIYRSLQEDENAEICYSAALNIENVKQVNLFIKAHAKLAALQIKKKDWNAAHKSIQKALEMGERCNDELKILDALLVQGDLHMQQQNYTEAIQAYENALKLAKKHQKDKHCEAALLSLILCSKHTNSEMFGAYLDELASIRSQRFTV